MTAAELSPELRNLVDARLDAIERVLIRVELPYSERRHILGEVESQIFELLSRRSVTPSAEDIAAVLNSLDPPASYIPEELRGKLGNVPEAKIPPQVQGPRLSRLALGSAAGLAGTLLLTLPILVAAGPHDLAAALTFLGVLLMVVCGCGILASARILRSNGQLLGLRYAFAPAVAFPLFLANLVVVLVIVASHGVIAFLLTAAAILYLNYRAIRRLWHWMTVERGAMPERWLKIASGWFSPKNGIQPT